LNVKRATRPTPSSNVRSMTTKKLFAQAERGAYAPAANVRGAFRADEFEV
jgi:hypothetical protein